jgi:hypothetical protein
MFVIFKFLFVGDYDADIQLVSPACMVKRRLLIMQGGGGNHWKINLGLLSERIALRVSMLYTGLVHFWLCTGLQLFHFMCLG